MLEEAASLFHLLGGMGARHLMLVGGLVPPLLAQTATEAHAGSADVDMCLSVAITTGATREYYKSIEATLTKYFAPDIGASHRWIKRETAPGVPLVLDFLAPEVDEDTQLADGVRGLDDEVAAANAGPRLRPFALKAGALMERDRESTELVVERLYGEGRAPVQVQHTGPVGLLAGKAEALNSRDEHKDGYDIAWLCLELAPTAAEVAELISQREAFKDPLFAETLALLLKAFAEPDYPGPVGYASISLPPGTPTTAEEHVDSRNRAHVTVLDVAERLQEQYDWAESMP